MLIGQRIIRFWNGEKYIFEYVGNGDFKCVHQDSELIPMSFIDELKELVHENKQNSVEGE